MNVQNQRMKIKSMLLLLNFHQLILSLIHINQLNVDLSQYGHLLSLKQKKKKEKEYKIQYNTILNVVMKILVRGKEID